MGLGQTSSNGHTTPIHASVLLGMNCATMIGWVAAGVSNRKGRAMKHQWGVGLVALTCVGAAACHMPGFGSKSATPAGQVAATVDGQEVTIRELRSELVGVNVTSPAQKHQAEQLALQRIIERKILAKAALAQGVDKTPDFALAKDRAVDTLLAQGLEAKIANAVPPPTREEAQSYVSSHPDTFTERKIFLVDQIRMARPTDPAIVAALKPLNTIDEIAAMLTRDQIRFQRGTSGLDALGADPRMIEAILKLPPNEVFVVPSGNMLLINQVKETRTSPFTGEPAIGYAESILRRQHSQEAVSRQLGPIVKKAVATGRYNKAYQPTPAAPAAAPSGAPPAKAG